MALPLRVLVVLLCFVGVCLPDGPITNKLSFNVDDQTRALYLDGVQVTLASPDIWDFPDIIPLPDTTRVIAILGENLGEAALIVASDLGGWVLTDAFWKYSTVFFPDWEKVDFDDSAWNYSFVIRWGNDRYTWSRVQCVSRHASLIWSPNYHDFPTNDNKLYFRLRIQRDRLRRSFDLIQSDAMLSNAKGCFRRRRLQCAASCSQMTSLCAGFQHNKATAECCLLTIAQLNSSTQPVPGWNIWSSIVLNEPCLFT